MKALSFQLRGDYQAPQVIPQGKMYAIYGLDGGVRYDISKKLNVSLNGRDILNTRKFDSEVQYNNPAFNSYQYTQRRFGTSTILATIAYRFGSNMKPSRKEKTQDQQDQDNGGGGDDSGTGNQQNLKNMK